LDISDGVTPWVNAVKPEWRDNTHPEAGDELERIPWDMIESS